MKWRRLPAWHITMNIVLATIWLSVFGYGYSRQSEPVLAGSFVIMLIYMAFNALSVPLLNRDRSEHD